MKSDLTGFFVTLYDESNWMKKMWLSQRFAITFRFFDGLTVLNEGG